MLKTTGKNGFNMFLNIYFEHIRELPNHLRSEKLRSQKEGKYIEINVIFYISFLSRYFQFINIFDGEGKADVRRQRN